MHLKREILVSQQRKAVIKYIADYVQIVIKNCSNYYNTDRILEHCDSELIQACTFVWAHICVCDQPTHKRCEEQAAAGLLAA